MLHSLYFFLHSKLDYSANSSMYWYSLKLSKNGDETASKCEKSFAKLLSDIF